MTKFTVLARRALTGALIALFGLDVAAQSLPVLPAPPAPEPSAHLSVISYGAKGDGSTKDTAAFQNAINAAAGTSGGAVVDVPGGHTYLIGSISLKSNVWLNVESGATIQGSDSASDYPLVTERWEGTDTSCHQGLIAATGTSSNPLTNIAIIGSGTIKSGATVGALRSPRRPTMIEPRYCKGVLIQDITVSNIRMWTVHPTYCEDVTISGMIVKSQQVNSDGLDPDSCARVLIEGCNFSSGDDDIAIKSGKGTQGATDNIPCQDVTIENCTFTVAGSDSGTIAFGSELSGGIQRVLIENNTAGPSRAELYLKTTEGRGGYISDVTVDTLTGVPTQVVEFNTDYVSGSDVSPGITSFNNISISNVSVKSSKDVAKITGDAKLPLNNISLSGFTGSAGSGSTVSNVTNFHESGISVTNGSGFSESNVTAGVTASPAAATLSPGGTATFAVTVPSGLSGTVTLKMGGDGIDTNVPPGATASFSPGSLSGSGSSTLTVNTSSSTPAGNYALIILASNGTTTHAASVTLTVGSGGPPPPPPVADPVFSPAGGSYAAAQNVSISTATSGATIRYTTDGSTPTETHGTVYSGPVNISTQGITKLEAIAYEAGFTDSNVIVETYTIGSGNPPPTLNFEAESLSYTPNGATASVQTDTNSSGGKWVELAGNSTGDYIDFTVPNVPAGTYQLQMEWKGNNTRGILQLSVDGTNLGPTLDQYSSGQTYPTTTFGNVTFSTTGNHDVRLTVTGKNSKSSSYQLSADKFTFVGQ